MANPLRIMSRGNWADSSIISTGAAAVASLPASNLLDDDIQKIWRTASSTGDDALIIDLTAQREIGAVALINTNLDLDDTIHLRISTSDPTGVDGDAYNSGVVAAAVDPEWPTWVHFVEPAAIGRYIRIGADLSGGPWEAGRLVVCPIWAPSRDRSLGAEPLWDDPSLVSFSIGGNEFVDQRQPRRGHRFRIMNLTETEAREQVAELNRLRGIARDILVCIDKDSTNLGRDTLWGRMAHPARQTEDLSTRNRSDGSFVAEFEIWNRN